MTLAVSSTRVLFPLLLFVGLSATPTTNMDEFNKEQHLQYRPYSSVNGNEFISLLETQTEDFRVGSQLESFIRTDNKQGFVSFLKTQKFDNPLDYCIFETRLLKLLCFRRAIGCMSALLNGETGLRMVDLNKQLIADPLECEIGDNPLECEIGDNPRPLQVVAKILCYGLTKLFIEHGVDPTCGAYESRDGISELPLKLALDALCDHKIVRDFPAGESVYKLFSLFRHQELKEPLDTIKLLASRTKQQQVMILGVCCVEEWNLVKLAALLMVAWDTVVIDNDIYSSPIAMLIGLQHGLESDLEKKEITRSMWQAFKLMEMSGNFLMENRTTSMVEHEVVPLQVAANFLTEVKLHDKETHMVSADLDRWAAELSQRHKDLLETAPSEKKCSSASHTPELKLSADLDRWVTPLLLADKVLLETRLMKKMCSKPMTTECIYFTPKSPDEDVFQQTWDNSFDDLIERAMLLDDRYEFVKLVNGVESFGSLDCKNDLPEIVRELMFLDDSANCAAAVLAGETDAFLKFRDLTDVGWSFLHNAAKRADPKLTALFLENGFLADDRRDCDELKINAALPLNVALDYIRDHDALQDWKDNKSAIDLVVLLCDDAFRNILETVRLLVLKTTDVKYEVLRYFKEGKMVELCALLMVAYEELLPPFSIVHYLGSTSITHNAGVAGARRHFSTSTGHGNSREHRDPLEIKGTLLLLNIFEKIGDQLSAYIRLEHDKDCLDIYSEVAWLIGRAGISDALVSNITAASSSMSSAGHNRVRGRRHDMIEQHSGLQSKFLKPAALSTLSGGGTPCTGFARSFHASVLNIKADYGSFVSVKRLVTVLRRPPPPMRCISIVAALTSGFRLM